ncbi:TIGR00341 family protein [Hydrogenimonas sp.]
MKCVVESIMPLEIESENQIFFLHHHSIDKKDLDIVSKTIANLTDREIQTHIFKKRKSNYPENSILFTMVPDDDFLEWIPHIKDLDTTIIILPYEKNPRLQQEFDLPQKPDPVLDMVRSGDNYLSDRFLFCNGKPAAGCISVGESEWIEDNPSSSPYLLKILQLFKKLFSLRLRAIELTSAKAQNIKTAALLVEAGRESMISRLRPNFFKIEENRCWRTSAVVYAPQSVVETLKLRLLFARVRHKSADTLPKGIGVLKSQKLTITATDGRPLQLFCNGKKIKTDSVEIESVQMRASILTGEKNCAAFEDKESIRVQNLPTDNDTIDFFTRKTLPFIPIATEDAFAELFMKLKESAVMTTAYMLLLIVSVLMATTGLFQNSSPTIIGAMILAPLMAPIIAFSMGVIRFDEGLMTHSAKTILLSIAIALIASASMAWTLPFTHVTEQISMRTHPTLLDLAVAILAGIAAAYGYANSKVGESLAGVAIAVALVPPLTVAGIGIGWGSWSLFSNAFLLFLANIVGIVFASGIMFYLMGFASRRYVSTAFFIKLMMVGVIAIPLWLSTRTLVVEEKIYDTFKRLRSAEAPVAGVSIHLQRIERKADGLYAFISVISSSNITNDAREAIARYLKKELGKDVHLVFTYLTQY